MADLSNALDKAYEEHICKLFDVLCTSLAMADTLSLAADPNEVKEEAYATFRRGAEVASIAQKRVKP